MVAVEFVQLTIKRSEKRDQQRLPADTVRSLESQRGRERRDLRRKRSMMDIDANSEHCIAESRRFSRRGVRHGALDEDPPKFARAAEKVIRPAQIDANSSGRQNCLMGR